MLSVHDALEAWQAGDLSSNRTMALTGAANVMELYAFASTCGVEIRTRMTPAELAAADAATVSIRATMGEPAPSKGSPGK
jgi:hypothetical protein